MNLQRVKFWLMKCEMLWGGGGGGGGDMAEIVGFFLGF